MADDDKQKIELTPNFVNIVAGNPGATFTVGQLVAAAQGRTGWFDGCVERLYYLTKGSDLDGVQIVGAFPGYIAASNLNDFRERFEEASCCGQRVAFCVTHDNRIVMLHVYRCDCRCDKHD